MNFSEKLIRTADKERDVYIAGFKAGYVNRYDEGYDTARTEGYEEGHSEGYNAGHEDGIEVGKQLGGYAEGEAAGIEIGKAEGFDIGYGEGLSDGLVGGKQLGYDEAEAITKAIIDRTIAGDYEIPEGITEIGVAAFQYCRQLTSVKIPESVMSLGASAFGETYLTELVLPMNCSVLKSYALSTMRELVTLKAGGLKDIANNAFTNNTKCILYDFSKCTQVPTLRNVNAFSHINAEAKILVPSHLYGEWIVATNWSQFADYIVGPITFYIDGVAYPAEEGMTWGEWIESEYNTIGATNGDYNGDLVGYIYVGISPIVNNSTWTGAEVNGTIEEGSYYRIL